MDWIGWGIFGERGVMGWCQTPRIIQADEIHTPYQYIRISNDGPRILCHDGYQHHDEPHLICKQEPDLRPPHK